MTNIRSEPRVQASCIRPSDVPVDLLIIPVFDKDDLDDAELTSLDEATGGELRRARERREFQGKKNELFVTPLISPTWQAERVALVGVGSSGRDSIVRLRTAAATVASAAQRWRAARVAIVIRGDLPRGEVGQALVEGLLLGGFKDRRYKTGNYDDNYLPALESCQILSGSADLPEVEAAVQRGVVVATSANLARLLSNEPSNILTPAIFADRSLDMVSESGIDVEVLDEEAIKSLGMGMLLGVARGSVEPPRVIVMRHTPPNAPEHPVLGLVGKGVTFDSGGISIKPADGMDQMKRDMSGGAAVVGAMRAIGALGVPTRTIGVVAMTENMPGGRATKPGDVLTGASGTTVEVLNTDAEGRLILGDALWYVRKLGATHLVDVATLTGACVVALGNASSGLFGQPTSWVETVKRAGIQAGERLWPLPLYDDYREQLKSEIADLVNIGGRAGGACTAAAFLQAFVGDMPWAHIDIAGTAWVDDARPSQEKGATGVMVRTLCELATTSSSW